MILMSNPILTEKTKSAIRRQRFRLQKVDHSFEERQMSDLVCNHHAIPVMSASWKHSYQSYSREVSDLFQVVGLGATKQSDGLMTTPVQLGFNAFECLRL